VVRIPDGSRADLHLESPEIANPGNIPGIYQSYDHLSYMTGIYRVYTWHMKKKVYTRYIPGIFQSYAFSRKRNILRIYQVYSFRVSNF
jgi:hypothetical protein